MLLNRVWAFAHHISTSDANDSITYACAYIKSQLKVRDTLWANTPAESD